MKQKKLSDELVKYGYVFSTSKTIVAYLIMVCITVVVGLLFRLNWPFIIGLCLAVALMLPLFLRSLAVNRYEMQRFSNVNMYMEQFMYSFMKNKKVLATLEEVEELFDDSKMKDVLQKAKRYITKTFDASDVIRNGLRIIEDEYNYEGLKTMHDFVIQVEEKGGAFISSMQLLLEARRMWADRVYEELKIRKHQRSLVLMSIVTSLGLCFVIYFMSDRMNLDVGGEMISQIVTFIVIIADMFIYYLADKKLTVSFINENVKDEELLVAKMKRFTNYKKNPRKHFLSIRLVKRQLTKEIEKTFPRWLMQVSLLLQRENVQVAIFKSVGDAPPLLQEELKTLVLELKRNPTSMHPYNNFLSDFNLPEVRSAMKMLFSLSEGAGSNATEQIEDIIRRNQFMLDKSERIKKEEASAGMYALFLAPQLTGGAKLIVDMILLLVVYLRR